MSTVTYYVYELIDPRSGKPFYVGKGKNNRAVSHISRAKKWKLHGFGGKSVNKKLYHKILSIIEDGFDVLVRYVQKHLKEEVALQIEKTIISEVGLENLCNLTMGGEGETRTQETIKKMVAKRKIWLQSPAGIAWRKKISNERMSTGNPMWQHKENPEKTKARMQNCLSRPRWNKGLKNDPRCVGPKKGTIPSNAFRCKVTEISSGETFVGYVKEAALWSKIPRCTFMKMLKPNYRSRRWSRFFKIERVS